MIKNFFNGAAMAAMLGALGTMGGAQAASIKIFDFEEFNAGDLITSIARDGLSATVSTNRQFDVMAFDGGNPTGNDNDLADPFSSALGSQSFGIFPVISEDGDSSDPDDNARGGRMIFRFDQSITFISADLLDIEEPGVRIILDGTNVFGRKARVGASGDNQFAFVDGADPVRGTVLQVRFRGSGAIDNLAVQPVPLPGAALLFGTALGIGAAIRRWRPRSVAGSV